MSSGCLQPSSVWSYIPAVTQGEALALFTAGAIVLAPSLPPEAVSSLIVPLLARAADHGASCMVHAKILGRTAVVPWHAPTLRLLASQATREHRRRC